MRIFIIVLVFIFSLQYWIKADEISEFEIEGISIGDSLLDYVSKDYIEKQKYYFPNNKEFAVLNIQPNNDNLVKFTIYDNIQFYFRDNDYNYKIYAVRGKILYRNGINLEKCISVKKEIINDVKKIFDIANIEETEKKHSADKTGRSLSYQTNMLFEKGTIAIDCYDWHEDMKWLDNLSVAILHLEFENWLNSKAY